MNIRELRNHDMGVSSYASIRMTAFPDASLNGDEFTVNFLVTVLDRLNIKSKVFGVFEHKGILECGKLVNPHYHFLLVDPIEVDSKFKQYCNTFRKNLINNLVKLNSHYQSMGREYRPVNVSWYDFSKIRERGGGYYYLCKGQSAHNLPIVVMPLLTSIEIDYFHNMYWEGKQTDVLSVSKSKSSTNKDEEFGNWFIERCLPKYKSERIDGYKFDWKSVLGDVMTYYRSCLNKGFTSKLIEHKMYYVYNSIVYQYSPRDFDDFRIKYEMQFERIFGCYT